MNKIKVIELLNMISKGEEVPKKIEYEGEIYEFNKNIHGYWGGKNNDSFRAMVNWRYLNNEVEILEEENKIPEKLEKYYDKNLEEYVVETYIKGINYKEIFNSRYDEMIISKINEVLDYLKSKGDE